MTQSIGQGHQEYRANQSIKSLRTDRWDIWLGFRQAIQTAGKDVDSLREIYNAFDSCFCGVVDYPVG